MVELEPENVLAISMFSLLALGGLAQFLQSRHVRYSPQIILGILLIICVAVMMWLSTMLNAETKYLASGERAYESKVD